MEKKFFLMEHTKYKEKYTGRKFMVENFKLLLIKKVFFVNISLSAFKLPASTATSANNGQTFTKKKM